MKIAVTYENGMVFGHFGHTEQFKVYEVEDGKVVSAQVCPTNGSGHGALAGFLAQHGVDCLTCGGIGPGAQMALAQAGIKLYAGCTGDAERHPDLRRSRHLRPPSRRRGPHLRRSRLRGASLRQPRLPQLRANSVLPPPGGGALFLMPKSRRSASLFLCPLPEKSG